jgi:hypothetical protein
MAKSTRRTELAKRIFIFTKLSPGLSQADYEKWLEEVDYPAARAQDAILSYEVFRAERRLMADSDESPWEYVEVIDVTDMDEYFASADNEAMAAMLVDWNKNIGEFVAISTDIVD